MTRSYCAFRAGFEPATCCTGIEPFILLPAGTSIVLPVGYMDQPTGLLHIIPLEEVMWQAGEEVYSDNFEFLKITATIVFNQRFEPGTLGSDSQCSSTAPSWDLYVKSRDNVVNAEGRANEIGRSWYPADLLDFQLPTSGTSQRPPIDPMQTHVA